ncbi:MAG: DUF2182 domain-containing protein [Austwickia sp.]|nr:MAG: DUF2182 domain-containing protein [Austwickia sp.]
MSTTIGWTTAMVTRPTTDAARPDRLLVSAVLAVAALAWVGLALTHGASHGDVAHDIASPGGLAPDVASHAGTTHGNTTHGGATHRGTATLTAAAPSLGPAVTRAAGWVLMVVAMMLPPAVPLLRVVSRLAGTRPDRAILLTLTATAFTALWSLVGLAYLAADAMVRAGLPAAAHTWLQAHPGIPAGAVVVAAGLWQFSPAKRACLTSCRSPAALALLRWGSIPPRRAAAWIGAQYGAVCVGCCWALMALTLVVGMPAMPVMVTLALVMALERLLPSARPFVPAIGAATVILGVAVLAGAVPAAWVV